MNVKSRTIECTLQWYDVSKPSIRYFYIWSTTTICMCLLSAHADANVIHLTPMFWNKSHSNLPFWTTYAFIICSNTAWVRKTRHILCCCNISNLMFIISFTIQILYDRLICSLLWSLTGHIFAENKNVIVTIINNNSEHHKNIINSVNK